MENCKFIKKLSNLISQPNAENPVDTEKLKFTNLDVKSFVKLMILEY